MNIKVNDSKDPVAEQDSLLVQVDYANQPIPNNRLPKGLYYSFKNKWVDMITLLTPAIKKIITANTTVPAWGSITGTLSNQTDLQSALDSKQSNDLTDSHIFVGDATNKATDVEMTGDVTIDNVGVTTLADTAVGAGTYGNSTNVPQITVDSKGRITSASNVAISVPTVTPSALTKNDDTNVTLTLGGTPTTALLQAVSLTLGWSGTLADSRIASAATWNAKEPAITAGTTGKYWRGDKSWQTLDKTAVGLGNVDNTSDSSKPISTATQNALDLKANKSEVATVLFKSITQTIITGKTVETSIYSIPLPTDGSDYMIKVYSQAQISTYAGSGNINHRLRVGTYSSVIDGSVGANSIGQQTVIAINGLSSANQFPITRNFKFVGGASGYIYGSSASQFTGDDGNSTILFSLLTSRDFTTQHYLYVSFNPSNAGAVVQHNQILVTAIKK